MSARLAPDMRQPDWLRELLCRLDAEVEQLDEAIRTVEAQCDGQDAMTLALDEARDALATLREQRTVLLDGWQRQRQKARRIQTAARPAARAKPAAREETPPL